MQTKKLKSLIALFAIILNIFSPFALAVPAYAEEPSPSVTPSLEPSILPSPTLSPTPSPSPSLAVSPSPSPSLSPTPTPVPTTSPSPSPTPEPSVSPSPTPTPIPSSTPSPSVAPSPTPTPELTPTVSISSDPTSTLDPLSSLTGIVSTDKSDYGATETVKIFASNLLPSTTYGLEITSVNNYFYSTSITSDNSGTFTYTFKLDGIYRPDYAVFVKLASITIAYTTFTDKPAANLDQYGNDAPTGWQNGDLNASKATYYEGQTVPYRTLLTGLTSGATYTVTIEYDTTKSGKHAIDYLTDFDRTESADPCEDVSPCASGTPGAILTDSTIPAGIQTAGQHFSAYNANITGVSDYALTGTDAGDSSTSLTVTLTSSVNGTAVLAWGGHISTRTDWGLNNSAVSIPGSPYHMRLNDFTCSNVSNCSVGQQDRALSAEAVIFPGSITIVKDATPNGSTSFPYTASPLPLSNFNLVDDGVAANYTKLFSNITHFQNYSVAETTPTGWNLTGIVCSVTSPNNGSQTVVLPGVTINLKEGENVTCTFSNQQQNGTLHVIKHVVNSYGGTLAATDFMLHVKSNNTDVTDSPATGSESGHDYSLTQGSYVVSENTPPTGYVKTGITGDCDASGNVAITAGQSSTCTITNHDVQPKLTVTKVVINDNGGSAVIGDFPLFVDTTSVTSGVQNGFNVGTYTVSETGLAGYTGVISGDCAPNGSITLAVGDVKSCTITNDDQPAHLIVIKTVIKDNGGTAVAGDFTTTISGVTTATPTAAGVASPGVDNVLTTVGSYSVDEGAHAGYAKTLSTDCTGTIALGETKTCEITNDDISPTLTVNKILDPSSDDGLFNLQIDGTDEVSDVGDGGSTGAVDVDAGDHTVGEVAGTNTELAHYVSEIGGECDAEGNVTLDLGENKTCTITNTRKGHIVVDKITLPSGDTQSFNFTTTGTGYNGFSLTDAATPNNQEVVPGAYTLAEGAVAGWDSNGGVCDQGETPASLDVMPGETVTCTFTNTKRGSVTIIKDAILNDAQDFHFTGTFGPFDLDDDAGVQDGGDNVLSNTTTFSNVVPGTKTITESEPNQYWVLQGVACTDTDTKTPVTAPVLNGSVTVGLNPGQNISCTFTNKKLGPTRTQGFWQTHTSYTSAIFGANFSGGMPIGTATHKGIITNTPTPGTSQLFGAYYASIAKLSTGKAKRLPLDQARMILLQQLVTAKLNCAAFGCSSDIHTLVDHADAAYAAGLSQATILVDAGLLGDYNNSGDTIIITGTPGKATPKTSQSFANIPFWDAP